MSYPAHELRKALSYNHDTGVFTWRETQSSRALKGGVAGCRSRLGYTSIKFRGRVYLAHRLAWLFAYGEWPDAEIDHINCVRDDNRIANLRAATRAQNIANTKRSARNKSGAKGVSWSERHKKWKVSIKIDRRQRHLGYFRDIDAASAAYQRAAVARFGEFARPVERVE